MEKIIKSCKESILALCFEEGVIKVDLEKGFKLKSGVKSPMFFDSEALESASRRDLICSLIMMTMSRTVNIDAFVGVVSGGISWASCFAASRVKPLLRARAHPKTYGLCNQIGGELPFDGAKTVVIDDVITTGNAAISVVNALRKGKNGKCAKVIAFISIFDWDFPSVNQKFIEAGISKVHIFSFKDVLEYGKAHGRFSSEEIVELEKFYKNQVL